MQHGDWENNCYQLIDVSEQAEAGPQAAAEERAGAAEPPAAEGQDQQQSEQPEGAQQARLLYTSVYVSVYDGCLRLERLVPHVLKVLSAIGHRSSQGQEQVPPPLTVASQSDMQDGGASSSEAHTTMVESLFGGRLASTVVCGSCGHNFTQLEQFMCVTPMQPCHVRRHQSVEDWA